LERTIARLRSRVRYLKDNDANTSLFHKQASCRKRKNFIPKLLVDSRVVTTQEDKHQVLLDHFDGILGRARTRSTSLNLEAFHRAGVNLPSLEAPFTEDEVWATIKALPADRAPGPDGFTVRFFKSCWHIIKVDLMAALISLHQGDLRNLGGLKFCISYSYSQES